MEGGAAPGPEVAESVALAAPLPSKSPMEQSADALAGVEAAVSLLAERKAPAAPPEGEAGGCPQHRGRSDSIEGLLAAGSLLKGDAQAVATAAAASAAACVPNPIAAAAAAAVAAGVKHSGVSAAVAAAAALPTGFRKKSPNAKPVGRPRGRPPKDPQPPPPADGRARKAQVTYNPDVPMTKEQLTAWRREMRRVRNRESAAASRRKVRDRIEELEEEVAVWKRRYQEVAARLGRAEAERKKRRKEEREAGKAGQGDDAPTQV